MKFQNLLQNIFNNERIAGWVFILPALLGTLIFIVIPIYLIGFVSCVVSYHLFPTVSIENLYFLKLNIIHLVISSIIF